MRTIKLATESNLGYTSVNKQNLAVALGGGGWSARLVSQFRVDSAGHTAQQRIKRRRSGTQLCLFAEFVWRKPLHLRGHERPDMEETFLDGDLALPLLNVG